MVRKTLLHTLPLVLLGLFVAGCSTSTPQPPETYPVTSLDDEMVAKIDALVAKTMKNEKIPGLAIGVIKDNKVAYSKGYGFANVSTGQKVTPETVFQMGSDSKMMVGIAAMQLKAQGKLDLDAPVTRYLPYFHIADERYKQITIRHILSHRSGLPWCSNNEQCDTLDYKSPEYDDGALERHVRNLADVKLDNPPGTTMSYSDLGFEIMGDIISKLSGESFEDYIQEHVFSPQGMKHSSFKIRDIPTELLAAPHILNPTPAVNGYFPYSRQHAPSSHLFSNVDDMNRYALVQLNHGQTGEVKVASASAYETMWTPEIDTTMPSPWEKKLGLGWFLGGQPGHRLVGHAGGDTGFTSEFIMAPDDGMAVVVLINLDYQVEELAYQVMQWLLSGKVTPQIADKAPQ